MCHCPWPEKIKKAHMFLKFQANASPLPNTKPRGYERPERTPTVTDLRSRCPSNLTSSRVHPNQEQTVILWKMEIVGALWSLLRSEAREWRQNVSISQASLLTICLFFCGVCSLSILIFFRGMGTFESSQAKKPKQDAHSWVFFCHSYHLA